MPHDSVSHFGNRRPGGYQQSRRWHDDDRSLFTRYQREQDLAARDALVSRFLPLANHLARTYGRGGAQSEDISQVAAVGLLRAIDRFDPDRGIAFSTFAVPTILGEIKRYFRDKGWIVRIPRRLQELALDIQRATDALESELESPPTAAQLAERLNTTLEDVLEARVATAAHFAVSLDRPSHGQDSDHPLRREPGAQDDGFERVEATETFDRMLAILDERQRTILRLRFEHDFTQAEIAEHVGLSQMHVSRLIRQAIGRLQATTPRPRAAG